MEEIELTAVTKACEVNPVPSTSNAAAGELISETSTAEGRQSPTTLKAANLVSNVITSLLMAYYEAVRTLEGQKAYRRAVWTVVLCFISGFLYFLLLVGIQSVYTVYFRGNATLHPKELLNDLIFSEYDE